MREWDGDQAPVDSAIGEPVAIELPIAQADQVTPDVKSLVYEHLRRDFEEEEVSELGD
jgi:hypothetical protein